MTHLRWSKVMSHDVFSHTRPSTSKLKGGPGYEASTVSLHSSTEKNIWNR